MSLEMGARKIRHCGQSRAIDVHPSGTRNTEEAGGYLECGLEGGEVGAGPDVGQAALGELLDELRVRRRHVILRVAVVRALVLVKNARLEHLLAVRPADAVVRRLVRGLLLHRLGQRCVLAREGQERVALLHEAGDVLHDEQANPVIAERLVDAGAEILREVSAGRRPGVSRTFPDLRSL